MIRRSIAFAAVSMPELTHNRLPFVVSVLRDLREGPTTSAPFLEVAAPWTTDAFEAARSFVSPERPKKIPAAVSILANTGRLGAWSVRNI